MSFLENENDMLIDAEVAEISEMLFETWTLSNLDEGQQWADYQFAIMSNSPYIKRRYNEYYNLQKGESMYVEYDEGVA